MPFTIINNWNECGSDDVCVDIPTLAIQEHDQEAKKDYIFTVKAINGAGASSLIPSDPFNVSQSAFHLSQFMLYKVNLFFFKW